MNHQRLTTASLTEEQYGRLWAKLAKSEGHRGAPPIDQAEKERIQASGRKGSQAALHKHVMSTKSQKACQRAMFLARKYPPLMSRHLMEKYNMSDSYARKVINMLAEQGLIKQAGKDELNAKKWVVA